MLQAGYDIAGIGVADLGVSFTDLDFTRRPIPCLSSAGTRYSRSVPVGMPKIERRLLDTVVYLYADRASAEAGKNFGGTGFMVFLPGELFPEETAYFYAVTNWHVAVRDGFSTIRINTTDGIDVLEFEPHEWHFLPQYDIAVIPMPFNARRHKAAMIKSEFFVNRELFSEQVLGVGSDVFMLGRFIDHDGGQTNMPAARFGNISVLPAPIVQPNHVMADSFCIDMHSRTGYSGSPVFTYKIPSSEFAESAGDDPYFGLFGIHWGQFPEKMPITEEEKSEATNLILEGQYIKGLSGMNCVLPAWTILEVLTMPKLKKLRKEHSESKYTASLGRQTPNAESASPPSSDANPNHREDFNSLVNAAVQKPELKD